MQERKIALDYIEVVDGNKGLISVLGTVAIELPSQWYWYTESFDNPDAKGAIFLAYDQNEETAGDLDIAYLLVSDVSDDPSEPDISTLEKNHVETFDHFLSDALVGELQSDGREIVNWMFSQLNEAGNQKGLVTVYVQHNQGKDRQEIQLRMTIKGKKFILIGCFDVDRKNELAVPIYTALTNAYVLG